MGDMDSVWGRIVLLQSIGSVEDLKNDVEGDDIFCGSGGGSKE